MKHSKQTQGLRKGCEYKDGWVYLIPTLGARLSENADVFSL